MWQGRSGWVGAVLVIAIAVLGAEAKAARLALVIGNDEYRHVKPLQNAASDAKSMAAALRDARFDVMVEVNQDRNGMNRLVRTLAGKVSGGDDVVVFFSGHGVQLGGVSYLLPVDIRDEDAAQVRDDAVALQRVLDDIAERNPRFTLVLVDACRDNPFSAKVKNVGAKGLAPTSPAEGQMVVYAAGAGQKALDRLNDADRSPNGVFTRVWLKAMQRPGVAVHEMARAVRAEVKRLALGVGHAQVPELNDQSVGDFFFAEGRSGPREDPRPSRDEDAEAYEAADAADTIEALTHYLEAFPKGRYAAAARIRVAALRKAATPVPPAPVADLYPAGKGFEDCSGCPRMVVIPGGSFVMGSPPDEFRRGNDEGPQRTVEVGKFALGKTEVTRGEFRRFVQDTGRSFSGCSDGRSWESPGYDQTDDHPVVCVSWEDAQSYAQWVARKSGQSYRLASEAEWEYAARAGSRGMRHWGNGESETCRYANVADRASKRKYIVYPIFECDDGYAASAPVGSYRSNDFGLYDMLGNVREWVEDCWNESYRDAPSDGSTWKNGICSRRMVRGGYWFEGSPDRLRSARRDWLDPARRDNLTGFRIARTLP